MNITLLIIWIMFIITTVFGAIMSLYFSKRKTNSMCICLGIMWFGIIGVNIITIFL